MKHFIVAAATGTALAAFIPADVASATDFYAGKTITIITSTGEGGGYDTIARALTRHMPQHIPGNPSMIVQNMPGGGHMLATNFMYNVAEKDGTVIATVNQNVPAHQVLDGRGVRYDAARFNWIGALMERNSLMAVWHTAGVETIEDAMEREVIAGATGEGSSGYRYPTIMNNVLGTRFKIIKGYKSVPELLLAMERGEVEARGGGLQSYLMQYPDWIPEGKIRFLVQVGHVRDPELPDVPLWTEVAKTQSDRQVLQLLSSPISLGRPYLAPPDVPDDRLAILRNAFAAAVKEEGFRKEGDEQRFETDFMSHDEVTKIVHDTINAPSEIVERAKVAMQD